MDPKVSVIIPTCNRPELLKKAIESVIGQSYKDWELIIVDDGDELKAEEAVNSFADSRIRYLSHAVRKGGGVARNTGIKNAQGEFITFLDDDDEWLKDKLKIQMEKFANTPKDVGFCFSAVKNCYNKEKEEDTQVPSGTDNYFELALSGFKYFLTVTLIIKKDVILDIGYFNETLPSHQETDLIIRISKKYKGLGINQPLVKVNMSPHGQIGLNLDRRIQGRKLILSKFYQEYIQRPKVLSFHYFQLALWLRDSKHFSEAKKYFKKSWQKSFKLLYFLHYLISFF